MKVCNKRDVTRKDIFREVNLAVKSIGKLKPNRDMTESAAIIDVVTEKYKDVMASYSIVVKYAVYAGMYSELALKHYLKWVESHPWLNTEEYIRAQAMYVGILYRCLRGVSSETEAKLRETAYNSLKAEHDKFVEDCGKVGEAVEAKFRHLRDDRNREFLEWCIASVNRDNCANAGHVESVLE